MFTALSPLNPYNSSPDGVTVARLEYGRHGVKHNCINCLCFNFFKSESKIHHKFLIDMSTL